MEIILILVSLIILSGIGLLFFKLNTLLQKPKDDNSSKMIQQQVEGLRSQFVTQLGQITEQVNKLYSDNQNILQKVNTDMTQTLTGVNKNINSRLDNAAKVISDVHRKLGEVHETSKQVQEVGKDISSLQEILRAPKIRGGMGELFLSDLLKQVLPSAHYKLQHYFKSREAVDAVIILREGMVPVDSKFPLENFKKIMGADDDAKKSTAKKQFIRDVKKHIDAIRNKYILPDEGTFDFALMYIPAENVYYETIIKDENLDEEKGLFQYAISKKVLPVSPNSFYAYLQTILLGLRGMKIEAQAQDILKNLARLGGDFSKIADDFGKVGTHIKNLNAAYENTDKRLGRFGDKLESLEEKETQSLPIN
ncbi:MAG: DNA recombination protein RmuC [Candidatus Saganbacteria bacterium]|nr:DNA recombination protein RmuC [Candidatus Saganbacteria bacterium]